MLVVDRVELIAFDQAGQVGELQRDRSVPGEHQTDATDKVVQIGYLGQDVVANDQIGPSAVFRELPGGIDAKELDDGRHSLLFGNSTDIRRRLDAQHGHAAGDEVLEQIPVITGQLDDEAALVEPQSLDGSIDVLTR